MTSLENQAPLPETGGGASACTPLNTLKKRAEFLACAKARRAHTPGMVVQGRQRRRDQARGSRVGFTCSKKVGNAVARNRAKRRLREAAKAVLPRLGRADWDYVLIGKAEITASRRFTDLVSDLESALKKLHGGAG